MKVVICTLTFLLLLTNLSAQVVISGKVSDQKQMALTGANVFLQGSYDGTTADSLDNFSFKSKLTGPQNLSATFIGYKPFSRKLNLDSAKTIVLNLVLEETGGQIDEVVINAEAFEASDEKKAVIMRMFDVATTPSAQGDIFGALCTLPGVQKVGEDGRVFVRVNVTSPVIFTTAYEEYAIKAFKVNSVDYLLKPIAYHELEAAFQKFGDRVRQSKSTPAVTIELLNKVKDMLRKQYKTRFVIKVKSKTDGVTHSDPVSTL